LRTSIWTSSGGQERQVRQRGKGAGAQDEVAVLIRQLQQVTDDLVDLILLFNRVVIVQDDHEIIGDGFVQFVNQGTDQSP
jgi:hypothetical protein